MHISPIGPSGTINLETKFESLPPVDQKTNAIATRLINSMDPTAPPIKKQNFLLQINQLVAEIMQLVSRLSDRERIKTDLLKQEYNDYNTVVSNAIISSGKMKGVMVSRMPMIIAPLIMLPNSRTARASVRDSSLMMLKGNIMMVGCR